MSRHVRLLRLSSGEHAWTTRVTVRLLSAETGSYVPFYRLSWVDEQGARVGDTWGMAASDWADCVRNGHGEDSPEAIALMLRVVYAHGTVEGFAHVFKVSKDSVTVEVKSPRAKRWARLA